MAEIITIPENSIIYDIELDLHNKIIGNSTVYSKQYDTNTRFIRATIWNNGSIFPVPSTATIYFAGTKSGNDGLFKYAGIDTDGKIVYLIKDNDTNTDRSYEAEFRISDTVTDLKSTPRFKMLIEKSALQESTPIVIEPNSPMATIKDATDNANKAYEDYVNATKENTDVAVTNLRRDMLRIESVVPTTLIPLDAGLFDGYSPSYYAKASELVAKANQSSFDNQQIQINNLVLQAGNPESTSAEIALIRGDSIGVNFPTAKDHLDNIENMIVSGVRKILFTDWENGTIETSNGVNSTSYQSVRIRTSGLHQFTVGEKIHLIPDTGYSIRLYAYNSSQTYIGSNTYAVETDYTIAQPYIRFVIIYNDTTTVTTAISNNVHISIDINSTFAKSVDIPVDVSAFNNDSDYIGGNGSGKLTIDKTSFPFIEIANNMASDTLKTNYGTEEILSYTTQIRWLKYSSVGNQSLQPGTYFVALKYSLTEMTGITNMTVTPALRYSDAVNVLGSDIGDGSCIPRNTGVAITDYITFCKIVITAANNYHIALLANMGSTGTFGVKIKFTDLILIKVNDNITNLELKDYINAVKSYGFVHSYPLRILTSKDSIHYSGNNIIDAWGDSLTRAYGYTSYTDVLQSLLGSLFQVNNYGVGGETTKTIAGRQGGMCFIVQPNITIPSTTTPVEIILKSDDGGSVAPMRQSGAMEKGVNPCYISGIMGELSVTQSTQTSSDAKWFFTRSVAGTAKTINRPTPLITKGHSFKGHTLIIYIGQNGGYDTLDEWIQQIRKMIDYNGTDRYIVLGLSSSDKLTTYPTLEKEFYQAFGRHYICLREYMSHPIYDTNNNIISSYGLDDVGVTPTSADLTNIANGQTPMSLLGDGLLHGNNYYYQIIANLICARGKDLGYWG